MEEALRRALAELVLFFELPRRQRMVKAGRHLAHVEAAGRRGILERTSGAFDLEFAQCGVRCDPRRIAPRDAALATFLPGPAKRPGGDAGGNGPRAKCPRREIE